ncbi:conserved hypothetical protein [Moraxellaceae bacterium 17A]|nr:conserved hypothetical protein [Moraxellaceae bacterium 17A]
MGSIFLANFVFTFSLAVSLVITHRLLLVVKAQLKGGDSPQN